MDKVTISRKALEVLKSAAWLWSIEDWREQDAIRAACYEATDAMKRADAEQERKLDALGRLG